jgi:hypothetical protein
MPGPNPNLQPPAVRSAVVSEIKEHEEVTGHTDNGTKANVAGVRYTECFVTWRVVADQIVGVGANKTVKQRPKD